jgi:hypothetical protein
VSGEINIERKPRRLRMISGSVAEVEEQLNRLLDDYIATTFNFAVVGTEIRITVLLMHQSEMRKAQLMMAGQMGRGH